MKNRLSSVSVLASLLTVSFMAGAGCTSSSSDASLTVHNNESFAITDIYVDAVGDESFSDNLLGNVPLQPGQAIIIDVACDHYDVELIDEAGGDCKVFNTNLCFSDSDLFIDNNFCDFSARSTDNGKTSPVVKVPRLTIPSSRAK